MTPVLGWTMLSREEMRQVERSLANSEHETRDEIGFLLLHQGFADRFFPGTSVLHTRIRYAFFVPWLYQRAVQIRRAGSDVDTVVRRLLIELAYRLKVKGGEPQDVIGGDKLGQLTSQPPDLVYWSALRTWGLLLSAGDSRSDALRGLQRLAHRTSTDDDGGSLDETPPDVFASLPHWPSGWDDKDTPLVFKLLSSERDYLRRKLSKLLRDDLHPTLLANLVAEGAAFQNASSSLPKELDAYADSEDKAALAIARDTAALAAIGRAVYGALVEELRTHDGKSNDSKFRTQLTTHFERYGEAAGRCDLEGMKKLLPDIPPHVVAVLQETRAFARQGNPIAFWSLRGTYTKAEVLRKTGRRARLTNTTVGAQRRAEWNPKRHNTTPLHYRWDIVHSMLADLSGS